MIDTGAILYTLNGDGLDILSLAILGGEPSVVRLLLDVGFTMDPFSTRSAPYLNTASESNSVEVAKLLVEAGADPLFESASHPTALEVSLRSGSTEVASYLLSLPGNPPASKLLHDAAESGSIPCMELLYSKLTDGESVCETVDRDTILHAAVRRGHTDLLEFLLRRGEEDIKYSLDINARSRGLMTPLHVACILGKNSCVEVLCRFGADPRVTDQVSETALDNACTHDRPECIEALLSAHPTLLSASREENTRSALHKACGSPNSLRCVQVLLDLGEELNFKDKQGATALHKACGFSSPEVCAFLVKKGADVFAANESGQIPLHVACFFQRPEVVNVFLNLEDKLTELLTVQESRGWDALSISLRKKDIRITTLLVGAGAIVTATHRELANSDTELSQALASTTTTTTSPLESKNDESANTQPSSSPASSPSRNEASIKRLFWRGVVSDSLLSVRCAVEGRKYDVNAVYGGSATKDTALHEATRNGSHRVTRYLCESGADMEAKTRFREETPLMYACSRGHLRCVQVLLDNGCKPLATDKSGMTALHKAAQQGHTDIVRFFISQKGVSPDVGVGTSSGTPLLNSINSKRTEVCRTLIELGASVNAASSSGETPLHVAADFMMVTLAEMLIENGADPTIKDEQGKVGTILFSMCVGRHVCVCVQLLSSFHLLPFPFLRRFV